MKTNNWFPLLCLVALKASAFQILTPVNRSTALPGFFDKLLQDAFSNDASLSTDKTQTQIEYDGTPNRQTQTAQNSRQVDWLSGNSRGAPVNPVLLRDTRWKLSLYLAGAPDKDPSNDLYGRKTNMSGRDNLLPNGVECPQEATVEFGITLEEEGVCRVEESAFTSGEGGTYEVSPDNQYLRFSLPATGFQRTVKTKGTITKAYWSEEDDKVTKTSTTYTIPNGFVYGDVKLGYGSPGEITIKDGILRFEKRVGLVGSKMVICGRVEGKMLRED